MKHVKTYNEINESKKIMEKSSMVHDIVDQYLPEAPNTTKDDLVIFINQNIDIEIDELERLMKIISKLSDTKAKN